MGEQVGTVDATYASGEVTVTVNLASSIQLSVSRVYAGNGVFQLKNGESTVAPGQYRIAEELSGGIYVIVHEVGIPVS